MTLSVNLPILLVLSFFSFVSPLWYDCSETFFEFKNGGLDSNFTCGSISINSTSKNFTTESFVACKDQNIIQDQPIYGFSGTALVRIKEAEKMTQVFFYSTVSEPKSFKDLYGIISNSGYFYYLRNSRIFETDTLKTSKIPSLVNHRILPIGVAVIGDISLAELKTHLAVILGESNEVLQRDLGLKIEVAEIRFFEGNEPWMLCGSNLNNQLKFAEELTTSISPAANHWHIFYNCPINFAGVCKTNGIAKNHSVCFSSITSTHETFLRLLGYRLGATESSDSTIMDPKSIYKKMEFSKKSKREIEKNSKYISNSTFNGPLCSGFKVMKKQSILDYVWNFLSFLFTPFSYLWM